MPSPFPGMNPFLENDDAWEDFHHNFISQAQAWLSQRVGEKYLVKVEVRLYLHELSAEERRFFGRTDVGITDREPKAERAATATLAAPVQLHMPAVDIERHASLEIRDRRNRRLVTAIELLSPTNKRPGEDRDDYLAKRRQLLASRVHLVEVDLRRGGMRPEPPKVPACDYYVLVSRADDWPSIGFWPIGLREQLPDIPIPLQSPDPHVLLDLQAVLHRVYDSADYAKYIYTETPQPPLSPEDAAWVKQFVPAP